MERAGGRDLIAWGVEPGPRFKDALNLANALLAEGVTAGEVERRVRAAFPPPVRLAPHSEPLAYGVAIEAETAEEEANVAAVRLHMDALMRCPVLEHGAIMPDACPAGHALGTIPVGGVAVSRGIHPAFHSADICCSMYATVMPDVTDVSGFMDALAASTRFGPGSRRPEEQIDDQILDEIRATRNPFLRQLDARAGAQLADQGDGNHFAYLGVLSVTSALCDRLRLLGQAELAGALASRGRVGVLVTHHGSRDLGAQVYKRGQAAAEAHTRRVSPETPKQQAWLDANSDQGEDYWQALQYVSRWTRRNHELVHERTLARLGVAALASFGNEHNFVWRRGDHFFHGKGATPAWRDPDGHPLLGLIPLNMAAPILLTVGGDREQFASFSPHGAGRNKSRTQLLRELGIKDLPPDQYLARSREVLAEQTAGLDVRFFYDRPDASESPIAYKSADAVRAQIERFGLAEVLATIEPRGCLMAGDYDKPWEVRRRLKHDQ